jgi:hypothetical protein
MDGRIKRGVALPNRAWCDFTAEAKRAGIPLATWVQRACRDYIIRQNSERFR